MRGFLSYGNDLRSDFANMSHCFNKLNNMRRLCDAPNFKNSTKSMNIFEFMKN